MKYIFKMLFSYIDKIINLFYSIKKKILFNIYNLF